VKWWGKISGTVDVQADERPEAMKKVQSMLDRMSKSFVKPERLVPKSLNVKGATWTKAEKKASKPAKKKAAPKKPAPKPVTQPNADPAPTQA
jgi:hypothetical protein